MITTRRLRNLRGLEEQIDEHHDRVDRDVPRGNEGTARHHTIEINARKRYPTY